jgi:hypothetical protein
MARLRRWSVLIVSLLCTSPLAAQDKAAPGAQDKAGSPWGIDRALTVTPQGPPVPVFRYRLLPLSSDLKEGNAVPIYLRLAHEQTDELRNYRTETPKPWLALPVDKMPRDEAHAYLKRVSKLLRQIEVGARRRSAEWNYTLDEPDPIGLLLPDVQWMRNYAPMINLQARVALADGDFSAAAHHLETGFAFSRHVADGPTLIHRLVGLALVTQLSNTVGDFIERPNAPNLYWALTALPRPLIDIRSAVEWEYNLLEMQFPELRDLDTPRPAENWDAILRQFRTSWRGFAVDGKGKVPEWVPTAYAPDEPASKSPDLAAARKYVASRKGLTAAQVEAMPAAQVVLMYIVATYHNSRDDSFRGFYLAYAQSRAVFEAADKRLKAAPTSEGQAVARLFLPALSKAQAAEARVERNLAVLRAVEAVRMQAAANGGKLPQKLSDVTIVPVPNDPGTDRPFEYQCDGDTATITSQVPNDSTPRSGVRYRVTLRK